MIRRSYPLERQSNLMMICMLSSICCFLLLLHPSSADVYASLAEMGGFADAFRLSQLADSNDFAEPRMLLDDEFQTDLFENAPKNPFRCYLDSSPLLGEKASQFPELVPRRSSFSLAQADLPRHWWDNDEAAEKEHVNAENSNNIQQARLKKTGTTIVGICGDGFCVLGADTRATESSGGGSMLVADRRAAKLHWLTRSVLAAGAGTSADLQHICRQTAASLAMQELPVGNVVFRRETATTSMSMGPDYLARHVRVHTVCRMLQDILLQGAGSIQAYLIVGGVDPDTGKASLRSLYPHGSMDQDVAYTALGSGGYAAMGVLESRYRPDLTIHQAVQLVRDAVAAGIQNDLGSGSQIDICILSSTSSSEGEKRQPMVQYIRSAAPPRAYPRKDSSPFTSPAPPVSLLGINGFGGEPVVIRRTRTLYDPDQRNQREDTWVDFLHI